MSRYVKWHDMTKPWEVCNEMPVSSFPFGMARNVRLEMGCILAMRCPLTFDHMVKKTGKVSSTWGTKPTKLMFTCLYGYGSIPINAIFSGMNIHLPAILMWTEGVQGFDTLPYGFTWISSYLFVGFFFFCLVSIRIFLSLSFVFETPYDSTPTGSYRYPIFRVVVVIVLRSSFTSSSFTLLSCHPYCLNMFEHYAGWHKYEWILKNYTIKFHGFIHQTRQTSCFVMLQPDKCAEPCSEFAATFLSHCSNQGTLKMSSATPVSFVTAVLSRSLWQ